MTPLTSTFPNHRLGVLGDVAKVNCATCHQGVFKPLYGESMAKDYPELRGEMHHAAAEPAPAADAAAAPPTASTVADAGSVRRGSDASLIMEVVLATPRGFCAGVGRAIETVERALQMHGRPVYVYHEIVHNGHVVRRVGGPWCGVRRRHRGHSRSAL